MSVRVADLWNSDFGKGVREKGAKDIAPLVKEIEDKVGVTPAQIERLTVAFLETPEAPVVFIATPKSYEGITGIKGRVPGVGRKKLRGPTLPPRRNFAVCFLTNRTFVAGITTDVKLILEKQE